MQVDVLREAIFVLEELEEFLRDLESKCREVGMEEERCEKVRSAIVDCVSAIHHLQGLKNFVSKELQLLINEYKIRRSRLALV